jgi:Cd(II)/Pb(II)-responsive transcriptional regulator
MKIGELALAAKTQAETIRYYERERLLPQAPRSGGNYRIYGPEHLERLAFIRHCRSLDMTLDEIRRLLRFKDAPEDNCAEVNMLLDDHIGHVASRIRELKQLEKQLKLLREQCGEAQNAGRCGILSELSHAAASEPLTGVRPHVQGVHVRGVLRASAKRPS